MLYICSIKEQELIGGHKLVASLIIKNTQQTKWSTWKYNFNIFSVFLVVKHLLGS